MTDLLAPGTTPMVAPVHDVVLREVAPPVPTVEQAEARDRVWDAAVEQNPALFDGPVSLVSAATLADGVLSIDWARGTYRNFALRKVPGATSWLGSLFIAVIQPTFDGHIVVGQMNASTAAPGRWQLPGGTVDPPSAGEDLSMCALQAHAALELREEVGIAAAACALQPSLAIRADGSNIGVAFTSEAIDRAEIAEGFAGACAKDAEGGHESEFARIDTIGVHDLNRLIPQVEYLYAVVRYGAEHAWLPARAGVRRP